jgi:hypothetical protein
MTRQKINETRYSQRFKGIANFTKRRQIKKKCNAKIILLPLDLIDIICFYDPAGKMYLKHTEI